MSATTTPTSYSGKFISFEGTEGVGKTTAINQLCSKLDTVSIDYVRTREPGGSPFAEKLRGLLLDPNNTINDDTELLLMFAARCDHLNQVILPALAAGRWVICDRFIDSTMAYQGFGRNFGDETSISKINGLISQFIPYVPDLTLWLDLSIEEGMSRANKRGQADRFEQEKMAFFKRVHRGFAYQHQNHTNRITRIDAGGSVEQVATRVWATVKGLMSG